MVIEGWKWTTDPFNDNYHGENVDLVPLNVLFSQIFVFIFFPPGGVHSVSVHKDKQDYMTHIASPSDDRRLNDLI